MQLDTLDLRILDELQRDGSLTKGFKKYSARTTPFN